MKTGLPQLEFKSTCAICDGDASTELFEHFDRLYLFPGQFAWRECRECSLAWLSPRPTRESIGDYYPQDEYYSYQTLSGSVLNVTERRFLSGVRDRIRRVVLASMGYPGPRLTRLEIGVQPFLKKLFFKYASYGWGNKFPEYRPRGIALDVGSGNGRYLSYLKNHGWDVIGIDFSQTASDSARREFDIPVYVGAFEDCPFTPESFDYINLSHVVEHTFDPVQTMELVTKLLKPGGTAYIEVPNFDSFSRRRSGKYWYPWETPRHLFMFSPDNLKRLVEQCGLTLERLKTENGNFWAWDKTYKLEEKLGKPFASRPVNRLCDKPAIFALRLLSAINRLVRPMSGDFICCWVRK